MAGRRDRGQSDQKGGHRVTSHALHQRGLTGTVFADQSDDLTCIHSYRNIVKRTYRSVPLRQADHIKHHL